MVVLSTVAAAIVADDSSTKPSIWMRRQISLFKGRLLPEGDKKRNEKLERRVKKH
jgi:hypothetical protein